MRVYATSIRGPKNTADQRTPTPEKEHPAIISILSPQAKEQVCISLQMTAHDKNLRWRKKNYTLAGTHTGGTRLEAYGP